MCRAINCSTCGKTTWAGCGQHVDQVMAGIPKSAQCRGHADEVTTKASGPGFFGRLFAGRSGK